MPNDQTTLDSVIQAIQTIMLAIPDIGQVHSYIRFVTTEAGVIDKFQDPDNAGKIKAWTITRASTASDDRTTGGNRDIHSIVIRGWASLVDANDSERDFQNLVELVRQTFKTNRKLNGTAYFSRPMQATTVMSGAIGGFVVHYCELLLAVEIYPVDF